ncbi:MAG: P-loop NTPase fold protein [Pseudonocardiaceae bacterium]
MATDEQWDRLTQPAKAAVRWAWATAMARTGTPEPSGVLVDTWDLFVGLALAHLRDSPVSQLLVHFHIPAGALLTDGGARRYRPEAVLAAARRLPDAGRPQLDDQTEQILDYAFTAIPTTSDGLVELSMLFAALLETPNLASMALRTELGNRGVDVEPVLRSCREYPGARTSYADYLRDHHPYRPPEIQLPSYAPDEPRTRRPPRQPATEPRDLVGITTEVDAFAYLIASRRLTPPLAIGLFGDWGSGKSYFLRSVQRRIDELVGTEVDVPPFYRAIAQIEFNAWQYVEGNLWASLLEHLFRNLRTGEQDTDDLLEDRRREYLKQLTERTTEHRRAVEECAKLADEHQQAEQVVHAKTRERDQKLDELKKAQGRNPFRGWRPSPELSTALAEVGIDPVVVPAEELRQTLVSTGETLRSAGPVLGPLRTGGWRYLVAVVALVVVIGLGPLTSFVLSSFDTSAVSNVIASVSALLAGMTAYAAYGHKVLTAALRAIAKAQKTLDAELDEQREQFDQKIRQAESTLADTEKALEFAFAEEQRLTASLAELEAERDRITPSSVLADFVGNRVTSDDYRRHLGVPALVRQDLERLSRLIQQQHEADPAEGPVIDKKHAVDRVVLYIDDLDRCPTSMVIKVLEAVHLLLAFPLFVVVVAVDARWLESSLRKHYTQLNADEPNAKGAVPADYLEKIFQVPFWVRPLGTDTRRKMVRGLLERNLARSGPATGANEATATEIDLPDADLPEFTRLVESFGVTDSAPQPWLEAAELTVTGPELGLLEDISALIGATPRTVKRFVNVYLLLKSVGHGRGWPLPEQGQVAVLLAIATGLPELADELLPTLVTAEPRTLGTALPDTADGQAGAQLARLRAWLADHPTWREVALCDIARWVELILRFRFDRVPGDDSSTRH